MRKFVQPAEATAYNVPEEKEAEVLEAQPTFVELTRRDHPLLEPRDWTLWELPTLESAYAGYTNVKEDSYNFHLYPKRIGQRATGYNVGAVLERYKDTLRKPIYLRARREEIPTLLKPFLGDTRLKPVDETVSTAEFLYGENYTYATPAEMKTHISEPECVYSSESSKVYYVFVTHVYKQEKTSKQEKRVNEYLLVADEVPWENCDERTDFWLNAYRPEDARFRGEHNALGITSSNCAIHETGDAVQVGLNETAVEPVSYIIEHDPIIAPTRLFWDYQTVHFGKVVSGVHKEKGSFKITNSCGEVVEIKESPYVSQYKSGSPLAPYFKVVLYTPEDIRAALLEDPIQYAATKIEDAAVRAAIAPFWLQACYSINPNTGHLWVHYPVSRESLREINNHDRFRKGMPFKYNAALPHTL